MSFFCKEIVLVAALIVGLCRGTSADASTCGDWETYKDETCIMILDKSATHGFEEAQRTCTLNKSTLVKIIDAEKQAFVANFLFTRSGVVDNVWIGAKTVNHKYQWEDGTGLTYSNWEKANPKTTEGPHCVQMFADANLRGKWADEPCNTKNVVVCEKWQSWSIERMHKEYIESKYAMSKALEETKSHLAITQTQLDQTKVRLTSTEKLLDDTRKHPVPVGFIYVQLGSQPEPKALWPAVTWTEVTATYAGLFFRAVGGGAGAFGAVQAENVPRVTDVRISANFPKASPNWGATKLNVGAWSTGDGVYAGPPSATGHTHQFLTSGGEVRPKNMAMRIWKRSA